MIICNSTIALGDLLRTFNVMVALIKQSNEPVYVQWTNTDAGDLFPLKKCGGFRMDELPLESQQRVLNISWHDYIHGRTSMQSGLDFSSAVASHFKLNLEQINSLYPGGISTDLNYDDDPSIPAYDFVIAPYVLNNPAKNMQPEFWQDLVNRLKTTYDASVCVIGKLTPPTDEHLAKIEPNISRFKDYDYIRCNFTKYLENTDYFVNEPLTRVATLLRRVKKCFICPDTGPSHLMRYIGRPHLELFTWCMISTGSQNYEANKRDDTNVDIDKVMARINEMVQ